MGTADARDVTSVFVAEARRTLETMHGKIVHCLGQMSEEDVNWRSFEGANSVANIVVHLCGNLGQWIVAGVGGAAVERDRPGEFAREVRGTPGELAEKLGAVVRAADAAMAGVTAETVLEARRIQGWETTPLGAMFHAVSHFEGHAQQVVYIARLRLGEKYKFKWVPQGEEQVSGKKSE